MKKTLLRIIILSLVIFYFDSCNEPIFFYVHEETPILKPAIDGSPINFAVLKNEMYVASGSKIFIYSNNKWSEWKTLGDYVMSLSAAGNSLYALYSDNDSGRIMRYYNSIGEEVNLSGNVQSIHSSGNILFASVRNDDNNYTVFYREEGNADFLPLASASSSLKGIASDGAYYYLCANSGIFYVDKSQLDASSDLPVLGKDLGFTGIIELITGNRIAAITENGTLYEIDMAGAEKTITETAKFSDGRSSTGALAVWYKDKTDANPSLLLVGRKEYYYSTTTAYSNGYVEIELDAVAGGVPAGADFIEPGKNALSSIDNYDRYVSSLGKEPINHMIQAPANVDPNMTLFASTQQKGLWSYRSREENWQWNSEQ